MKKDDPKKEIYKSIQESLSGPGSDEFIVYRVVREIVRDNKLELNYDTTQHVFLVILAILDERKPDRRRIRRYLPFIEALNINVGNKTVGWLRKVVNEIP
jgi:hypothetical protein